MKEKGREGRKEGGEEGEKETNRVLDNSKNFATILLILHVKF